MERVEILWATREDGEWVERWIPGVLIFTHGDGTHNVRTECGKSCYEAAHECVRRV